MHESVSFLSYSSLNGGQPSFGLLFYFSAVIWIVPWRVSGKENHSEATNEELHRLLKALDSSAHARKETTPQENSSSPIISSTKRRTRMRTRASIPTTTDQPEKEPSRTTSSFIPSSFISTSPMPPIAASSSAAKERTAKALSSTSQKDNELLNSINLLNSLFGGNESAKGETKRETPAKIEDASVALQQIAFLNSLLANNNNGQQGSLQSALSAAAEGTQLDSPIAQPTPAASPVNGQDAQQSAALLNLLLLSSAAQQQQQKADPQGQQQNFNAFKNTGLNMDTASSNQLSSLLGLLGTLGSLSQPLGQQGNNNLFGGLGQPQQTNANPFGGLLQAQQTQQQQLQQANLLSALLSQQQQQPNLLALLGGQQGNAPGIVSSLGTLGSTLLSGLAGNRGDGRPRVRGVDTRFGVGYRIGDNADAQVVWEVGPQLFTDPLNNEDKQKLEQYYDMQQKQQQASMQRPNVFQSLALPQAQKQTVEKPQENKEDSEKQKQIALLQAFTQNQNPNRRLQTKRHQDESRRLVDEKVREAMKFLQMEAPGPFIPNKHKNGGFRAADSVNMQIPSWVLQPTKQNQEHVMRNPRFPTKERRSPIMEQSNRRFHQNLMRTQNMGQNPPHPGFSVLTNYEQWVMNQMPKSLPNANQKRNMNPSLLRPQSRNPGTNNPPNEKMRQLNRENTHNEEDDDFDPVKSFNQRNKVSSARPHPMIKPLGEPNRPKENRNIQKLPQNSPTPLRRMSTSSSSRADPRRESQVLIAGQMPYSFGIDQTDDTIIPNNPDMDDSYFRRNAMVQNAKLQELERLRELSDYVHHTHAKPNSSPIELMKQKFKNVRTPQRPSNNHWFQNTKSPYATSQQQLQHQMELQIQKQKFKHQTFEDQAEFSPLNETAFIIHANGQAQQQQNANGQKKKKTNGSVLSRLTHVLSLLKKEDPTSDVPSLKALLGMEADESQLKPVVHIGPALSQEDLQEIYSKKDPLGAAKLKIQAKLDEEKEKNPGSEVYIDFQTGEVSLMKHVGSLDTFAPTEAPKSKQDTFLKSLQEDLREHYESMKEEQLKAARRKKVKENEEALSLVTRYFDLVERK